MASQRAQSIAKREPDLPLSPSAPLPIGAVIAGIADPANPSPVAALHQRIEQAALQGFFDKNEMRRWHGGRRRAIIVLGVVTGVWATVFTAIWTWAY